MPLVRVDPGTLPRRDSLRELYDLQERMRQHGLESNMKDSMYDPEGVGRFSRPVVPKEEQENLLRSDSGNIPPISQRIADRSPSGYWGKDPAWGQLSKYEKAAAMSLLEADSVDGRPDFTSARNVLGAMINRADKEGDDLGDHVSKRIYQPTIEPTQYRRLAQVVQLPEFQALSRLAEMRDTGQVNDWVNGNTHFLAHESVMEGLRDKEPNKYRSWVDWTGYDRGGGKYTNPDGTPPDIRDRSHAFLAPEGRHSANRGPLIDMDRPHTIVPGVESNPQGNIGEANVPYSSDQGQAASQGGPGGPSEDAPTSIGSIKIPTLQEYLTGGKGHPLEPLFRDSQDMGSNSLARMFQGMTRVDSTAPAISLGASQVPDQDQAGFQVSQLQRRQPPALLPRRS